MLSSSPLATLMILLRHPSTFPQHALTPWSVWILQNFILTRYMCKICSVCLFAWRCLRQLDHVFVFVGPLVVVHLQL
jgi:hypothetical protein